MRADPGEDRGNNTGAEIDPSEFVAHVNKRQVRRKSGCCDLVDGVPAGVAHQEISLCRITVERGVIWVSARAEQVDERFGVPAL